MVPGRSIREITITDDLEFRSNTKHTLSSLLIEIREMKKRMKRRIIGKTSGERLIIFLIAS